MTATLDLDTLHLAHGAHETREQGMCLMEAVAYAAGEPHSDQPKCVSPVLRRFGITLNDRLDDERRQLLKSRIYSVIGTDGDGLDEQRRALARDWLMGRALPEWLELADLDLAAKCRDAAGLSGSELRRTALNAIEKLARKARRDRWAKLSADVEAKVRGKLAVAVADATAVADAVAVATAVADAVAVAAVDAVAVAAVDAVATAVAAAEQVDFSYGSPSYWGAREAAYNAVKVQIDTSDRLAKVRELRDRQLAEGFDLYDRMIRPRA